MTDKVTVDTDLANSIKEKLKIDEELITEFDDITKEPNLDNIDDEALIKKAPQVSIAKTLWGIERHLEALVYMMSCQVGGAENETGGLTFNREHLYSIYNGENVNDLIHAEEQRLHKLKLAEEKKELEAINRGQKKDVPKSKT